MISFQERLESQMKKLIMTEMDKFISVISDTYNISKDELK